MNVHETMENAIKEDQKKHKKMLKRLKTNKEEYFRIANGLIVIQEYVIRFSFDTHSLDIGIAGDHHVFKGMFGALRKMGYVCQDKPKDKLISSWCCWWYHEEPDQHIKLWITFSSTECTRVKVGTKMVEQTIYETVCK